MNTLFYHNGRFNLANSLTLSRILLIPVFVLVFYAPFHYHTLISALVFTLAAITDWLDGYLARKLGQITPLGAFLDPVADKLMVVVALVLIVAAHASAWLAVAASIIIAREVAISALREWMALLGQNARVAVSYIGKVKTTVQMIAIIALLALGVSPQHPLLLLGAYSLLYLAALLTLWSMYIYLKAAWSTLT